MFTLDELFWDKHLQGMVVSKRGQITFGSSESLSLLGEDREGDAIEGVFV